MLSGWFRVKFPADALGVNGGETSKYNLTFTGCIYFRIHCHTLVLSTKLIKSHFDVVVLHWTTNAHSIFYFARAVVLCCIVYCRPSFEVALTSNAMPFTLCCSLCIKWKPTAQNVKPVQKLELHWIVKQELYCRNVLLNSFHVNGYTVPIQKLELHCIT